VSEKALGFINRLPAELARLPGRSLRERYFRRSNTGKFRDMKAAVRQLRQALKNDRWLDDSENAEESQAATPEFFSERTSCAQK